MQRSGSLDGLPGTSVLSEFMDDLSQPGSEAAANGGRSRLTGGGPRGGPLGGRAGSAPQVPLPGQRTISRGQLAPSFAPAFCGAGAVGRGARCPSPARHLVNLSKSDSTISSQITQMLRAAAGRGHRSTRAPPSCCYGASATASAPAPTPSGARSRRAGTGGWAAAAAA